MDALIGWDVGGAHVKASLLLREPAGFALRDVAQWPCPLWQGLEPLRRVLEAARARWPQLADASHALTMTGEMVDLFPNREAGVAAIAATLDAALDGPVAVFVCGSGEAAAAPASDPAAPARATTTGATPAARGRMAVASAGAGSAGAAPRHAATTRSTQAGAASAAAGRDGPAPHGWCSAAEAAAHWSRIASANWLASAELVAEAAGDALLVDVGSTTSDLIPLRGGRVVVHGRDDAARLASGELVYQGVVRTPLCALGPRIGFRGETVNLMNEFFATSADVYRLTGELDPAHDQHPAADGAGKDAAATRQRLARMIGRDARDAADADWAQLAAAWRAAQLAELAHNARRVIEHAALPDGAPVVAAGCGDFLVRRLAQALDRPCLDFAELALAGAAAEPTLARWVQVAAPSVAVALLRARVLEDAPAARAGRRDGA
jgi:probable H4MPT-linked C1 transfer pathway protein